MTLSPHTLNNSTSKIGVIDNSWRRGMAHCLCTHHNSSLCLWHHDNTSIEVSCKFSKHLHDVYLWEGSDMPEDVQHISFSDASPNNIMCTHLVQIRFISEIHTHIIYVPLPFLKFQSLKHQMNNNKISEVIK